MAVKTERERERERERCGVLRTYLPCYNADGRIMSKHAWGPKNFGTLAPLLLGTGTWLTRRNTPLPAYHLAKFNIVYFYQVRQKVTPKIICCFLTNRLEFLSEILPVYVTTLSTLKRQVAFSNL